MAFQHPVARPTRRSAPPPLETVSTTATRKIDLEPVADSQEWVLFSPEPHRSDVHSATDSLQTPKTAAKSRLDSELGSLDTRALSEQQASAHDDAVEEEDASDDLDSLDDGLHAFDVPTSTSSLLLAPTAAIDTSAEAILPTHDGLGAFPGSSSPVQEQFWRHEKANPHKRRPSQQRASLQRASELQEQREAIEANAKDERFQRIEKWRIDQSRAIMEEIDRESRKLKRRSKPKHSIVSRTSTVAGSVLEAPPTPAAAPLTPDVESQPESFWTRLTRHVMRDLMGFDTATLTYIFGDDVHAIANASREEEMMREAERIAREDAERAEQAESDSWEEHLLARIARELGSFVHQVSEHPGAFSSFLKAQEDVPYAGMPTPRELQSESAQRRQRMARHRRRSSMVQTDPTLFGIEEEAEAADGNELTPHVSRQRETYEASLQREKDYWERDLDVKMVFGYLRNRLSGSPPSSSSLGDSSSLYGNTSSTRPVTASSNPSDSLRRAALIRHHHPLVSKKYSPVDSVALPMPLSPVLGRRPSSVVEDDAASSCASQSTKKSKTRHSGSLSLGSSRNYWDIGNPAWGET